MDLSRRALARKEGLTPRERLHVEALGHMVENEHGAAMSSLLRLLEKCPGDVLALSLAMDVSRTIGNPSAAYRACVSVAAYWNERSDNSLGLERTFLPAHSAASSLIAVGLAAKGHASKAELLAERSLSKNAKACGGVASLALAHCYDAEGRVSEGYSLLAGDGAESYEGCGFLFFDARLAGYGAGFTLDREGTGADKAALRVYDSYFTSIFNYCGIVDGVILPQEVQSAPQQTTGLFKSSKEATKSIFQNIFASSHEPDQLEHPPQKEQGAKDDYKMQKQHLVNVLSWLPPTPQMLVDATLLLLKLTLSGALSQHDSRWNDLRLAWGLCINQGKCSQHLLHSRPFRFFPLAESASLLLHGSLATPPEDDISDFSKGLRLMGDLASLGGSPTSSPDPSRWKQVVRLLSTARDGAALPACHGWEMDLRPFLDQALCHAARLSSDEDSRHLARALCSENVTTRPNSPEVWWRYGLALDDLGDAVAAEDAKAASASFGRGLGGKGAH